MGDRWNDSGISTVVGLILILGLIVSVAAVVKLTYIPDVKKQLEADHMQQVVKDIQSFKAQLDMDQAATATGVGYGATASIEMGGGAIPGIDPSTSYGTLALDPSYGQFTVTAYRYPSGTPLSLGSATALGRLLYQSNNNYYASQNLSLECGMITLAQPGGVVMLTPPSFVVTADPTITGRPVVSVNALRLGGTAQSVSSGGVATVRTWLAPGSTNYASTNVTNVTFTIVSDYASLWYSYLSDMLMASGLDTGNYQLAKPNARTVTLRVNGTGTQNTGLYLADSAFGTYMGYSIPGTPVTSPTPTPSPTPAPSATPTPTSIGRNAWISNFRVIDSHGEWLTYSADVTLQVLNTGSVPAINVMGWCESPVEVTSSGPRNIILVSGPAVNPRNIPLYGDVTFVWRYTFDIKPGNMATFSLGAAGPNTNQINTTASVTG